MKKKILYLHGRGSKPGGTKPRYLETLGYEVLNPHLPDQSFEESVKIAQKIVDLENPDLVIGSSRGGAVAMSINSSAKKTILICPAWKKFEVSPKNLSGVRILHSEKDEIVPMADTVELVKNYAASLVSCGVNHRMIDKEALSTLCFEISSVLS